MLLAAGLVCGGAGEARAQTAPDQALNQYQPPEAGDDFMAVPSAAIGGHLMPHAQVILDYAYKPLVLVDENGDEIADPVSNQMHLHVGASFSLWDRLLIAASFPIALLQTGDDANVGGATFAGAGGVAAGDLRFGLRGRLFGEMDDPFQISVGGFLFVPSGSSTYSGDGSFYGEPHLLLSGKVAASEDFGFMYSANAGAIVKSSNNPNNFVYRAAAGALLIDEALLIGPELIGSVNFSSGTFFDGSPNPIERSGDVSAELLGTVQYRLPLDFVVGAGAGAGLADGVGTPGVRVLGRVMWDPQPEVEEPVAPPPADDDQDGIPNELDACPNVSGVSHPDPTKNGCPPDTDGDGILDRDDACPEEAGVASADPSKHGCPLPGDSDNDGIVDEQDACPQVKGVPSDDPQKNGCPPPDSDGDGIIDAEDACVDVAGVASADPQKNGCPPDTDGDGIIDPEDACPKEIGVPQPDPKKNGCPRVKITDKEIVILQKVEFDFGRSTIKAVSNPLLDDVAQTLNEHPEIELVEIQGHTDSKGSATYNKRLSQARADAVRRALLARKVDPNRLRTKGYGQEQPIADNGTEEGRAINRRVQFKILKHSKK